VAVIRALIKRPKLVLADEPTANLDDENARLVLEDLREACREMGATVVLTTTDMQASFPSTREYLLRGGVLRELR